jgi:hypothetical protein
MNTLLGKILTSWLWIVNTSSEPDDNKLDVGVMTLPRGGLADFWLTRDFW